ncbi:HD domain-containing protein [Desulfovibrionales bacterium]
MPEAEACRCYWDTYAMPRHIREHSLVVARVAVTVAKQAQTNGIPTDLAMIKAAALLHDIAKDYTISWGGNHAQLGGVWTMEATDNPTLALAVIHHVYWPWELNILHYLLPLVVLYADKRVCHDRVVTLGERFDDLYERYGTTNFIRSHIEISKTQAFNLERQLSCALRIDYHACTFDSGWLVE